MFSSARALVALYCVLCWWTIPVHAQDATEPTNIAQEIDALVAKHHEYGLFNGAALVAQDGEVVYKGAFGEADMAWSVPNTPGTRFRIGSVTKQFTAALILQLVEEGKIDLQAPITTYLPDYPKAQGDRVTVHHLLVHTSGIPSYTGMSDFGDIVRDPYTPDSFLTVFNAKDLQFEPGTQWSYNNSGYFILGVIIEKVTGQPYDEVLTERILTPMELQNTGYDHYRDVVAQKAEGYESTPGGYQHAAYLDTGLPYAAGMMYSTVEDLFAWDQALYGSGPFQSVETVALMTQPHTEVPNSDGRAVSYGYGWFVRTVPVGEDSVRVVEHGGGINGFRTSFWRMPDDRHTVILMDNTSRSNGALAEQLTRLLYGQPVDAPKRPIADTLAAIIKGDGVEDAVARYATLKENQPDAFDFSEPQLNRLGYAYLQDGDTDTAIALFKLNVEAYPEAYNTYDSLGEAYLEAGNEEQAIANYQKSLDLNPGNTNAAEVLARLGVEVEQETVEVPEAVLADYVGEYQVQPGFTITVTKEGTQLRAQATGQDRFDLFPMAENKFYLKVVDAQVTFNRGDNGTVESLTLHQSGRNVPAEKMPAE